MCLYRLKGIRSPGIRVPGDSELSDVGSRN